ncbi:MAG: ParM/StbA family protein [Cyanobacteria bacterium P01_F01_bin.3]
MAKTTARSKASGEIKPLVLAIDPGNGWIKFVDREGRRRCIPSFVKQLRPRESGTPDEHSALISLDGARYAVGEVAGTLGGQPLFAMGKAAYGHVAIAAAIAMSTPPTDAPIELRVLVPDDSKDEWSKFGSDLSNKLEQFQASDDIYLPNFSSVRLVPEGLPVWEYVKTRNLVPGQHVGKPIGVLDAGTGDLTGYLFTATGEIIRSSGASFIVPGFKALVGDLGSAIDEQIVGSADRAVLMSNIKRGVYTYQTASGEFDFSNLLKELKSLWLKELATSIASDRWSDYMDKIGMVYIVGGASPLLKPLEKAFGGRFEVLQIPGVEDPQVVNAFLLSQMA